MFSFEGIVSLIIKQFNEQNRKKNRDRKKDKISKFGTGGRISETYHNKHMLDRCQDMIWIV